MSANTIDYDALAKQYGATSSAVDYDALAKQHGAVASVAPVASHAQQPGAVQRFATGVGESVGLPHPIDQAKQDIQGIKQGGAGYVGEQVKTGMKGLNPLPAMEQTRQQAAEEFKNAKTWDEKAAAAVRWAESGIPYVGPQLSSASDKFANGDIAGGAGQSIGMGIQMAVAHPQGRATIADAASATKEAVGNARESLTRPATAAEKGLPQAAAYPEIGKLPAKAVMGAEDIFRASAPTGTNQGFRANIYAAKGDLAEIGRNLNLDETKGGIRNPDMRIKATVDAIGDYKQQMYQNERLPQIQRNADTPISTKSFGADAQEGLKYIQRTAGSSELRGLAQKALDNGTLSTAESDQLAMAVNQELKGFERMTDAERAAAQVTNRRLGSLKALDTNFSKSINGVLQDAGEPGLYSYERRFAALSEIEHQLGRRINLTELNQPGAFKGIVQPIGKVLTGGVKGIAGASQAAVADVNAGRMLQRGFQRLAESGLQPER